MSLRETSLIIESIHRDYRFNKTVISNFQRELPD